MRKALLVLACGLLCGSIGMAKGDTKAAEAAATAFLAQCDKGDFSGAYKASSEIIHKAVKEDGFSQALGAVRSPLGKVVSRKLESAKEMTSLPGAPDGHYVVMTYKTKFEKKAAAVETITPALEGGAWKVSGYQIR